MLKANLSRLQSDGLGGFLSVTETLRLGTTKHIFYRKFHFFLILVFVACCMSQDVLKISYPSLTLALQCNNELYKLIKHPLRRVKARISSTGNAQFTLLLIFSLALSNMSLWLFCILLRCGDIQPNPGPASVTSTNSSLRSVDSIQDLSNHLSIMHLNVQSLFPKIDLIKCEAHAYDILVYSESWLKPEIKDDDIFFQNFMPPYRTDRLERIGGGVVMYVRDTFLCRRRDDLEIRGLEAVWVEVKVKGKCILVGGFYRPPNSNNAYFNLIAESFDRAYNTGIKDIVITGDFNFNMLSNDGKKIKTLINQFNLEQVIRDPTHYTESSSSLIDLILCRNPTNVLHSGVIEPLLFLTK